MGVLQCPGKSNTGAYKISWDVGKEGLVILKENGNILYQGKDVATTVTGRTKGTYTYTLEFGLGKTKSQLQHTHASCTVEVTPPSLFMSFGLLSMGALVFVATLVFVVLGHRAHKLGSL